MRKITISHGPYSYGNMYYYCQWLRSYISRKQISLKKSVELESRWKYRNNECKAVA